MENKKFQIDQTKLTPEQRDRLDMWKQSHDQLRVLNDISDITQELVSLLDEQKKSGAEVDKSIGACLLDIREALNTLKDKEIPETPDFAKPVVEAFSKFEKSLSSAIKSIDVKPNVTVDAPQVNVASQDIDLKGMEKLLKTEIPKAFEKAISLIPKPEKTDFGQMLTVWEGISEQLLSLENATRMKPMPGSMKVSNLVEMPIVDISGLLAELTQKTEASQNQQVELINALRVLTQVMANPPWVDKSANALRNQVQSGTVTTVTTLTNMGAWPGTQLAYTAGQNTWANMCRRNIT